jgi:N-hydroxyarylamine O-acetyltransferase
MDVHPAAAVTIKPLADDRIEAYLARVGLSERPAPGLAGLRELHLNHLRAVPFENLSIHLGEPVSLESDDLFAKIVDRRRGGFCYELNGLFAALLVGLGYNVTLCSAGVYGPNGVGPPFDHLALAVDGWLCDVGFGRHSAYPLRLATTEDQADPCGTFRLQTVGEGDIEVTRDDALQYRLEPRPRTLSDFVPTCWWQQTWPSSHFRAGPVCSRLTDTFGLLTLAGRTLTLTEGTTRTRRELASDDEVIDAYRTNFGIVLDRVPVPVAG